MSPTDLKLEMLDRAGISLWKNRTGWWWAYQVSLAKVMGPDDIKRTKVRGPYPSCAAAGTDAWATHQRRQGM